MPQEEVTRLLCSKLNSDVCLALTCIFALVEVIRPHRSLSCRSAALSIGLLLCEFGVLNGWFRFTDFTQ